MIWDIGAAGVAGVFSGEVAGAAEAAGAATLNSLMAMGPKAWSALRAPLASVAPWRDGSGQIAPQRAAFAGYRRICRGRFRLLAFAVKAFLRISSLCRAVPAAETNSYNIFHYERFLLADNQLIQDSGVVFLDATGWKINKNIPN